MNETNNQSGIHEKFAFFSARKERETLFRVLETVIALPLDIIQVEYRDRPDERFTNFNDRSKKILMNLDHTDKIERVSGSFDGGGDFELKGGTFTIIIPSDQYNFEVIDSMRRILSPVFPLCIFQNPYIWGVDCYQEYERDRFFELRGYTYRSQRLEEPQVDIFRRDEGVITKFRFHLKEQESTDEGIRFLHGIFTEMLESLAKRAYEGIEVLHRYCTDRPQFRRLEPRTKLGIKIKSMLYDR